MKTMKLKKILSAALSAAMLVTAAYIPALAAYTAADYDVVKANYTYDDGTATNDIDGTKALKIGSTGAYTSGEYLIDDAADVDFSTDFFLSFDFRYDTVTTTGDDGTETTSVPGVIQVLNARLKADGNSKNPDYGPVFTLGDGQFRTNTSSSAYQNLGAISADTWYTAELEGKMIASDASVTLRLYDKDKNLIQETTGINLRNFSAGTSKSGAKYLQASNVTVDNVKLINEYADAINLTPADEKINVGSGTSVTYTMTRDDKTITKRDVTYSLLDSNGNALNDDTVSISDDGIVTTTSDTAAQTITVLATCSAISNDSGNLTGTCNIVLNKPDLSTEKFDTVTISGDSSVTSGESVTFTATATKDGETVELSDGDIVWSVYDSADVFPNNNKAFTWEDGTLTVADGTLSQSITVRASSASGLVHGSKTVNINLVQSETILASDACEGTQDNVSSVDSFDGSKAYYATATTSVTSFSETGDYVLTEVDIKFTANGTGFTLIKSGKVDSCFRYNNGYISLETKSNTYSSLMAADLEKWYHFEVLYSSDAANASCNIYEYGDDGSLGEKNTFLDISMRNAAAYSALQLQSGTYADNIKISTPAPDSLTITPEKQSTLMGVTNQLTAEASRNGLPLKVTSGISWGVKGADGNYITDDSITIDANGLMTVSANAKAQKVTVVGTYEGMEATTDITILSTDFFEVTGIGINEDGDKIVRLYADMNYSYSDKLTFITAIYDKNNILKQAYVRSGYGNQYTVGSNEITVDYDLPSDFDKDNDTVKVFVWTSF